MLLKRYLHDILPLWLFPLILVSVFLLSCEAAPKGAIQVIDTFQLKEKLETPNLQLLDVRTPGEFAQGSITGALNLDIRQEEQFKAEVEKLNKNQPVYVYCQGGIRSKYAAEKLLELGFTTIYDFSAGYSIWKKTEQN
jgi:rhodanese-related sulfurtransferase